MMSLHLKLAQAYVYPLDFFGIQTLLGLFKDYAFLWTQNVPYTFDQFLAGNITSACPQKESSADDGKSQISSSTETELRDNG